MRELNLFEIEEVKSRSEQVLRNSGRGRQQRGQATATSKMMSERIIMLPT